jgi:small GTP-binding protein
MQNYNAKVIIVGDSRVGKTCIVNRMIGIDFNRDEHPTIGFIKSTFEYQNENSNVIVNVWDTAGQERFMALTQMYFRGTDISILTYDITSKASFERLSVWDDILEKNGISGNRIVIVGNKEDMEDKREVSREEGLKYSQERGAAFIEVSALTMTNIEALKEKIAEMYLYLQTLPKEETPPPVELKKSDEHSKCFCK